MARIFHQGFPKGVPACGWWLDSSFLGKPLPVTDQSGLSERSPARRPQHCQRHTWHHWTWKGLAGQARTLAACSDPDHFYFSCTYNLNPIYKHLITSCPKKKMVQGIKSRLRRRKDRSAFTKVDSGLMFTQATLSHQLKEWQLHLRSQRYSQSQSELPFCDLQSNAGPVIDNREDTQWPVAHLVCLQHQHS
jgi:hypothetical protein